MECSKCGAGLEVEDGKAFAVCAYCGTHNRVRGERTLLAESAIAKAAEAKANATRVEPQEETARPTRQRPSRRGSPFAVLRVLPLIGVIAGACFFAFRPRQAEQLVTSVGERIQRWLGSTPLGSVPFGNQEPETLVLEHAETLTFAGRAAGTLAATDLATSGCDGFITQEAPVHVVTVHPGTLHLDVQSAGDTTLTVRTSEGRWLCDDDSGEDTMPRLAELVPVGVHEVWIGRFSSDEALDYELRVNHEAAEETPAERPRSRTHRRSRRRQPSMRAGTRARSPASTPAANGMSPAPAAMAPPSNAPIPSPFVDERPAAERPAAEHSTTGRGLVTVNTEPWSMVRVDGHVMGRTPRRNMVMAVGARVEVQLEGQGAWIPLAVRVVPGETRQVFRRFD